MDIVQKDYVYALSRFGMLFEEFLELTPVEFFDALTDKVKHEEELVLSQVRIICETLRLQTAHIVNVVKGAMGGRAIKDERKLMKFPWERAIKPAQTREEMKAIMKAIAKGVPKKKKNANKISRRRTISRKPNSLPGT